MSRCPSRSLYRASYRVRTSPPVLNSQLSPMRMRFSGSKKSCSVFFGLSRYEKLSVSKNDGWISPNRGYGYLGGPLRASPLSWSSTE